MLPRRIVVAIEGTWPSPRVGMGVMCARGRPLRVPEPPEGGRDVFDEPAGEHILRRVAGEIIEGHEGDASGDSSHAARALDCI